MTVFSYQLLLLLLKMDFKTLIAYLAESLTKLYIKFFLNAGRMIVYHSSTLFRER